MKLPTISQRLALLGIGLLCLVSFYGFSRYVKRGGLKNADFATTVKIQEKIDKSSRLRLAYITGEIMEGSTFFASPELSVVLVLLLTAVASFDIKTKRIRWRGGIIPLVFALLVLGEIYGKSVVHHPAPPFFMIKNPTTIFPKYYINEEFSYPSGHAARAVFISLVLFFLAKKQINATRKKQLALGVALGIYVGLVAVSRIYLGHHWLSDIIGGIFLGTGFALLGVSVL